MRKEKAKKQFLLSVSHPYPHPEEGLIVVNPVTYRQYRILADHIAVYQFMTEVYQQDWRGGVAAPFLEYALSSSWMDKSYTHRFRIWEQDGRIVALVFYENPVADTYFSLRPGYEFLAPEMIDYAAASMPHRDNEAHLVLFESQQALIQAAEAAGFYKTGGYVSNNYQYDKPLDYPLPPGFRFVEPGKLEVAKAMLCCWKGFDHETTDGPWDGDIEPGLHLEQAPHYTGQYAVAVENEAGEYVCYAGLWWVPENKLAYMEPLCTVPEYRHMGLASAALSEIYRRTQPLGATHMTGGGNEFYTRIGFVPTIPFAFWTKDLRQPKD